MQGPEIGKTGNSEADGGFDCQRFGFGDCFPLSGIKADAACGDANRLSGPTKGTPCSCS
jgi:hypothetical protein